MTDTKNPGDTLTVPPTKTLTLKRPSSAPDTVRQSFSHGRSKTVVVETVKRRPSGPVTPPAAPPPAAPPRQAAPVAPPPRPAVPPAAAAPQPAPPPRAAEQAPAPRPVEAPKAPTPAPVQPAPTVVEKPAAPVAAAPAPSPRAEAPAAPAAAALAAPRPAAPAAPAPAAPRPAAPAPGRPGAPQQGGRPGQPMAGRPPQGQRPNRPGAGMVLRTLSSEEMDARTRVLAEARVREAEERKRAAEEAVRRAAEEARREEERKAAEIRKREEEERHRREEETRRHGEAEARRHLGEATPAPREGAAPARPGGYGDRREGFGDRRPPREGGTSFGDRRPREGGAGPAGERRGPPREGGTGFGERRGPPREGGTGFGERRGPPREGGTGFGERRGPPREGGFGDRRPGGGFGANRGTSAFAPSEPAITPPAGRNVGGPTRARAVADDDDGNRGVRRGPGSAGRGGAAAPRREATPRAGEQKGRGRLTVTSATGDEDERTRSVASFRRRTQRMTGHRHVEAKEKIMREVVIPEAITIQELANRMSERAVDVIRLLMKQGEMKKINDVIDADTAQLIVEELGHTAKRVSEADVEEGLFDEADIDDHLEPRPPVVTIMGHVDHGKTSLLDAIRSANVVSGEAGGITQHIGAYQVTSPLGGKVTFIDTPGHAAFTAMRARGAKVTDIVVLVVAADDGVMPQTVEAINHAAAAKVPMIVAVNKIDKPDAKPERVRTELLQHNVQVESMGGETLEVEVSAKQRTNLDKLLEAIQLQAEILNLQANPDRAAEGTVIEAKLDRGRGPVATVLVQRGTLKVGDIVVAGAEWGRVRALVSDTGATMPAAGPSVPVEVLGFNGTPEAGDRVAVVENEARAREITEYRERQKRENAAVRLSTGRGSLADMMAAVKAGTGARELPLVVKADVQGSVEAIIGALDKVGNDEVKARVIHSGVGGITESDITLAEASGAAVIGFNVRAHKEAREAAERTGTEIRYYNIIYNLVDDVKGVLSGLLAPTLREEFLGNAQILEVFNISKVGKVAGCRVTDGHVERGANVRLIRDNVVIHEGKLSTLKRFKDEVKEVQVGQECGMAFENYQDMRSGDVIECYRVEEIKRTL
ncbi:translation initiation factor IF-2 [Labrys sp. LIt4]|uniref:translation initiation factor IF-2 n=1 Tax=Labrys sp. LIt4 TaxID=2821355 RepID=UPI001ADFE3BE|nr:translation initiation factor IF-2 [Labrys sp. LIt4]MBP0577711.1 translation initiation factor IF-2 [Labrys sp. LIt4]